MSTAAANAAVTKFTADNMPRIIDEVCDLIAVGYGLTDALAQKAEYPSARQFHRWLADDVYDICQKYARARELQQDYEADNIVVIADSEPSPDKARVRIDARKWRASKLAPKKYGDKIQQEVDATVNVNIMQLTEKPTT